MAPLRTLPSLLLALLGGAAACGGERPCAVPERCLRAERAQGTCGCVEWETVRTELLPVKYVVASVAYAMAGNESAVQYGGTGAAPFLELAYSPFRSRWRAVIRAADGTETVARAGVESVAGSAWTLSRATPVSVALDAPAGEPYVLSASVDVPTHALDDRILVWVNPRAIAATDFVGGVTVEWSAGDVVAGCGEGPVQVATLSPAMLDGTMPAADPCSAAFVAVLDDRERAELRAYDAFFDPPGREVSTLFDDPRLTTIENDTLYDDVDVARAYEWWCSGGIPDEAFEPLVGSEIPLDGGATLLVEHSLPLDADCTPRTLGKVFATDTVGCVIYGAQILDLAFGTLLFNSDTSWSGSGTPACTR